MKSSPSIAATALVAISLLGAMITGCAAKAQMVKTGEVKTVAILPFSSSYGGASGQEAADWIAIKLMEKGYAVIDRSRTTALLNDKKFYDLGMTDDVRNALQSQRIGGIVFGQIMDFNCEVKKQPSLLGNVVAKNRCTVSLTAKMADPANGKLVWALILKDSAEGADLTPHELMRAIIRKADVTASLPSGTVENPADVEVKPKAATQQ